MRALLCAFVAVVAFVLPVQTASAYEEYAVMTTGQFVSPLIGDAPANNRLDSWIGKTFSVRLSWSSAALEDVSHANADFDRIWSNFASGSFSVAADGGIASTSVLNFIGVQAAWVYDGALGILPAGTYQKVSFFGMSAVCGASSCDRDPAAAPRYEWNIELLGSPGMLKSGDALPTPSNIDLGKVLFVGTIVTLYENNTDLVGGVELPDASATRLDRLTLITTAVPEPSSMFIAAGGLLIVVLRRRGQRLSGAA